MKVFWDSDYSKKERNALYDSYDNAEWECPRCSALNPVWSRTRTIAGYNEFGVKYEVNYYCYGKKDYCSFRRKNAKQYVVGSKKTVATKTTKKATTKKKVVATPKASLSVSLKNTVGTSNKFWKATNTGKSVKVVWGKNGSAGRTKTHKFSTVEDAVMFLGKKIAEKKDKGYIFIGK